MGACENPRCPHPLGRKGECGRGQGVRDGLAPHRRPLPPKKMQPVRAVPSQTRWDGCLFNFVLDLCMSILFGMVCVLQPKWQRKLVKAGWKALGWDLPGGKHKAAWMWGKTEAGHRRRTRVKGPRSRFVNKGCRWGKVVFTRASRRAVAGPAGSDPEWAISPKERNRRAHACNGNGPAKGWECTSPPIKRAKVSTPPSRQAYLEEYGIPTGVRFNPWEWTPEGSGKNSESKDGPEVVSVSSGSHGAGSSPEVSSGTSEATAQRAEASPAGNRSASEATVEYGASEAAAGWSSDEAPADGEVSQPSPLMGAWEVWFHSDTPGCENDDDATSSGSKHEPQRDEAVPANGRMTARAPPPS